MKESSEFISILKKEIESIEKNNDVILSSKSFMFYPNDEIIYNNPFGSYGDKIANVLEYNPSSIDVDKRLFIKILTTNEEIWIDPSLVKPINHKQEEIRTRFHILKNNKYKKLHHIMDEYIIVEPNHNNGDKIFFKTSPSINNDTRNSITIKHTIAIPKMGFIYLGWDSRHQLPFSIVFFMSKNNSYLKIAFPVKNKVFKHLLCLEEIDII